MHSYDFFTETGRCFGLLNGQYLIIRVIFVLQFDACYFSQYISDKKTDGSYAQTDADHFHKPVFKTFRFNYRIIIIKDSDDCQCSGKADAQSPIYIG